MHAIILMLVLQWCNFIPRLVVSEQTGHRSKVTGHRRDGWTTDRW